MSARRLISVVATWLCVVAGLALSSVPAQAAVAHRYLSQITGTSTQLFRGPCGVTVDPASQDIYVTDAHDDAIDIFNSAGVYQSAISGLGTPKGAFSESACSVSVSDVTGEVYVADGPDVDVFNALGEYVSTLTASGTPQKSFGQFGAVGVAVDQSSGDVYVSDRSDGFVDRFNSSNGYLSQLPVSEAGPLATDSSGKLFVMQLSREGPSGGLYEFDSLGNQTLHVSGLPSGSFGNVSGVATDAAGHIYVSERQAVDEFESSGAFVEQMTGTPTEVFSYGGKGEVSGLAVNTAGNIYLAVPNNFGGVSAVDIFGPDIIVPSPSVQAPSGVSENVATLNGSVDPSGVQITSCDFEYGTSTAYGQSVPCDQSPAQIGSGSGGVAVTATVALQSNTTYFYRLNAENANGTANANGSGLSNSEGFTTPYVPVIVSESAEVNPGEPAGQNSAILGASINSDERDTTYFFEYGETTTYGASVPVPAEDIGSGASPVSVPGSEITGLKLDTTYHYRVVAHNEEGTVNGSDQTFKTLPAILIPNAGVSNATASSATFEGELNPLGSDTTYRFEYGTSTAYGTSVPVPDASVGSGITPVAVSVHIQGLKPGTLYHVRLAAQNQNGAVDSEDVEFTSQTVGAVGELPDNRVWEMVSPPNKEDAQLEPIDSTDVIQAAASGDAISYLANSPIESQPPGYSNYPQILSVRGADGWHSQNISPPHETPTTGVSLSTGQEYRAFSSDLSRAVVQPIGSFTQSLSAEASEQTAYVRSLGPSIPASELYTPLVTGCPEAGVPCPAAVEERADVPRGTVFGGRQDVGAREGACFYDIVSACYPVFAGGTPDLSHVALEMNNVALEPGASSSGLYEWTDGRLAFVGTPSVIFENHGYMGISDDGSRIAFEGSSEGLTGLVVRDMSRGESAAMNGQFKSMSSDGSVVIYKSGSSLYECRLVVSAGKLACETSDLTPTPAGESSPGVLGVLGSSSDGSWVYFVANGVLADGATAGTCTEAKSSSLSGAMCNLYVRHDGVTSLVAVISANDEPDWDSTLFQHSARVSPNGQWLAFMSMRSLTGYDNRDVASGQPAEEVFLYGANGKRLICASCNPTGARPHAVNFEQISYYHGGIAGGEEKWPNGYIAANIPGWTSFAWNTSAIYQSRYLSDSGRLFFNSSDDLVSTDVNDDEDVYEFEPSGVSDCTASRAGFEEQAGGCVGLISSGAAVGESAFLDASESGGDIFFLTKAKLTSQDYDSSLDVYDAQECSGASPCPPAAATVPPPCVTGDACKAAPTPQPAIFGSPSSATFTGAGNVHSETAPIAKPKSLTRAQKLTEAMKACKKKGKGKRAACEKRAKRLYGPTSKSKKKSRKGEK
jgi:hypothetical protein